MPLCGATSGIMAATAAWPRWGEVSSALYDRDGVREQASSGDEDDKHHQTGPAEYEELFHVHRRTSRKTRGETAGKQDRRRQL
jgi:hypothetical protein